jgi:hypothetical protein
MSMQSWPLPGSVAGVMLKPLQASGSNHPRVTSAMLEGAPIRAEPVMPLRGYS